MSDNDKKIPDIPDDVLKTFNSIYNEAFRQTIEDSRKSIHDSGYAPADHLSLCKHVATVFQEREKELSSDLYILKTCFLLGTQDSIKTRKFTMGMTNFMEDLTVLFMYAVIWINSLDSNDQLKVRNCLDKLADMKAESRRKGLESDLSKLLSKSWECQLNNIEFIQPPIIRDRFGLRIIFNNDADFMLKVTKIIIKILVNPESDYAKSFRTWVNTCTEKFGGVEIPKHRINQILDCSFYVDNIKDYINNPKENSTYQAWQATIHINGTSPILGGFMFELQAQTWDMYRNNEDEDGPASHGQHKIRNTHGAINAFQIADYDPVADSGMVFFDSPDNPALDMDGITVHARILSRHVSPHVI